MNPLNKYLRKRKKAILFLLEKPRHSYTPATFHQLRIEIKKLKAVFELTRYCDKNFHRKKTFIPFKLLFDQAGKVRELQIEEAILKKYFISPSLREYRQMVKTKRLKEIDDFFSFISQKFNTQLKKKIRKAKSFIPSITKKKSKQYLKEKRNHMNVLMHQQPVEENQLHDLRKQLKAFDYTNKSLNLEKQISSFPKIDILTKLLGNWHDGQVTIRHLNKAISSGSIIPKEKIQLEKIKTKIASADKKLVTQINKAVVVEVE